MAFLKKHVVWIILALVLAAEGGFTFVLLGKRSKAKSGLEELAGLRKRVAELKAKGYDNPEKFIKPLEERRSHLTAQLGQCALYFWQRGRALRVFFDDDAFGEFRVRPWDVSPAGFDRFKLTFQEVYNREADKLAETATKKLHIDRAGLGLAARTAFTQPYITVGDIYGAQREFWIRKAIVETAIKTKMSELAPIVIARSPQRRPGSGGDMGGEAKGALRKPILVTVVVRCPYPKLGGFVAELLRSPLSFRVNSVEEIIYSGLKGADDLGLPTTPGRPTGGRRTPYPGRGMTPEMMMEGPPPDAMPTRRPGRDMVPAAPEGEPVGGEGVGPAAVAGEEVVEAQLLCEVSDYRIAIARAKLTGAKLAKKASAKEWLKTRSGTTRDPARRDLLRALLGALDTATKVNEGDNTLEITTRPEEHFDQDGAQRYTQTLKLGRTGSIEVEFRLVTFEPVESQEGVAAARAERR